MAEKKAEKKKDEKPKKNKELEELKIRVGVLEGRLNSLVNALDKSRPVRGI